MDTMTTTNNYELKFYYTFSTAQRLDQVLWTLNSKLGNLALKHEVLKRYLSLKCSFMPMELDATSLVEEITLECVLSAPAFVVGTQFYMLGSEMISDLDAHVRVSSLH